MHPNLGLHVVLGVCLCYSIIRLTGACCYVRFSFFGTKRSDG